jgi:uncharacterized membrane protein
MKVLISTFLWAFAILQLYMITMFFIVKTKKSQEFPYIQIEKYDLENLPAMISILQRAFAFYEIIDSKLIGLIIFLNSNILTGLVNLSIDTRNVSPINSILILILHAFLSVGSGYLVYFYFKFYKNSHSVQVNIQIKAPV